MNSLISRFCAICIVAITLVSCNNNGNSDENQSEGVDSLKSNQTGNSKDYDQIGYDLMKNEKIGELKLGLKANKIIELLGKPEDKSKLELWGADDSYHQEWNYKSKGISFDFIGKTEEEQEVNMITISEPCKLKTSKQIALGNSLEDVKKAYVESIDTSWSDNENVVAGSIYGGVMFTFENNVLKTIFIGASAE